MKISFKAKGERVVQNLGIKSVENHLDQQKRLIENLKDIIQNKEYENARLYHENKALVKRIDGLELEVEFLLKELHN